VATAWGGFSFARAVAQPITFSLLADAQRSFSAVRARSAETCSLPANAQRGSTSRAGSASLETTSLLATARRSFSPGIVGARGPSPAVLRLAQRVMDLDALVQVLWLEASAGRGRGGAAEAVRSAVSTWDCWMASRLPILTWIGAQLTERVADDIDAWYPRTPLLATMAPRASSPKLAAAIAPLTPSLRKALVRSPGLLARLTIHAVAWWAVASFRLVRGFVPPERQEKIRDRVLDDVALALERHHATSIPVQRAMLPRSRR